MQFHPKCKTKYLYIGQSSVFRGDSIKKYWYSVIKWSFSVTAQKPSK